jgi:hypothetical protein
MFVKRKVRLRPGEHAAVCDHYSATFGHNPLVGQEPGPQERLPFALTAVSPPGDVRLLRFASTKAEHSRRVELQRRTSGGRFSSAGANSATSSDATSSIAQWLKGACWHSSSLGAP